MPEARTFRQKLRRGFSQTFTNFWLDIVLFLVFMIDWNVHLTGITIHEWLGILFGVLLIYHLFLHWNWMAAVLKRLFDRLPGIERVKAFFDALLFINMVVVVATGLWISEAAMQQLGLPTAPSPLWRLLHHLSAEWVLWLVGIHLALNWRWITNTAYRYIWKPLTQSFMDRLPTSRRASVKESAR